ncbi:MAG: DUF11 domain-containing protein, partial [Tannerella sp.]|nr:DUF11 domain-containing protein [Tannerella sp.]
MKKIILFATLVLGLFTIVPAAAQWSWEGEIYFESDQDLFLPVIINSDVEITVANGATVRATDSVRGNGHTMYRKGEGRFWFMAPVNHGFDADIVFRNINSSNLDSILLTGTFGSFVDDATGYSHSGSIRSEDASGGSFYFHQNDTVVQTFDAVRFGRRPVHFYHDTKSTLRLIHSSDSLSGRVALTGGGTLYVDGSHDAEIAVSGGRLITGKDSIEGEEHVTFAGSSTAPALLADNGTHLQVGDGNRPSLVKVTAGDVVQGEKSVLEIDVYEPKNWGLTTDVSGEADVDTVWKKSFSDMIYIGSGKYTFGDNDTIHVNWTPEYLSSIASEDTFCLPVIMLGNSSLSIENPDKVTVPQTLRGWVTKFLIGDGSNNTQSGWGYVKGEKIRMYKEATLNGVPFNGRYANPVSVLYGDNIIYTIKAINANLQTGKVIVTDTLPPYLNINLSSISSSLSNSGSVLADVGNAAPNTPLQYITWTITNINSLDTAFLTYEATPASGACASQPMYINYAWVSAVMGVNDTLHIRTNDTYHQGAGVSIVTFSASAGGQLFNAGEQALDYRTSPRAGVLIVPDNGYRFAGWSHDEYYSLRGERIPADSGIMYYDSLVIYGDVRLRADFVPENDSTAKETVPETVADNSDRVWAYERDIYIRTGQGALIRIYS